jgi:hypothetical protein
MTEDLRYLLETLDPKARDDLRRVVIRDQADRNAIPSRLMRYRDQNGQDWADIIDFLTMHPEARRRVVRLLGELTAETDPDCPDTPSVVKMLFPLVLTTSQLSARGCRAKAPALPGG